MPRMRSGAIFRAFRCGEAPRMRGGGAAFRTVSGRFSGCGCMPCVGRLSCEVSGPVGGGKFASELGNAICDKKKKRSPCSSFFCCPLFCCTLLFGCLQFLGCLQLFRPPPWREVIGFRRRCPPPRGGRPMRRGGPAAPRCRRPSSCPSSPPRCSPPGLSPRATPGRHT